MLEKPDQSVEVRRAKGRERESKGDERLGWRDLGKEDGEGWKGGEEGMEGAGQGNDPDGGEGINEARSGISERT